MTGWPALAAARRADAAARLPFAIGGVPAGSVARAHWPALRRWPGALRVDETSGVDLVVPVAERDAALAAINADLRRQGLIHGWRDEIFDIPRPDDDRVVLARTERAACRFWGTLTRGAHATGFVAGADGRPVRLWIARRSANKATDPGLYDNLVGGGVASGQSPESALEREAFEEAGLAPNEARHGGRRRVIRLARDIAEGFQLEDLHAFDIELPPGRVPHNVDGEVQDFTALPVAEALALAAGDTMTVDAALVTLDFALRHALLPPERASPLAAALAALCRETNAGRSTG